MCGIGVILYHSGRTPEAWRTQAMASAMHHRGPDATGFARKDAVALAHTRLSIVDIAHGAQPMLSPGGAFALTYNGEIYNYQSLRQSLQAGGATFRTGSDTEVVLNAYRVWGIGAIERLRGMFAFALHDRSTGELLLARDRFGIKPLYYYNDGDVFIAASEIKAIFATGLVKAELDRASIKNYFTYQYSIAPFTPFTGIYELPPAHFLVIRPGATPQLKRYWDMEFPRAGEYESLDENYWLPRFRDALQDAVASHMIGEVPIGAYLSGGIDSCSIVRLLADIRPIQTFSIGFDNPLYDESSVYRAAAEHCGVANAEIRLSDARPQGFLDDLVQCIYHLEQPQRLSVDIPHYLLSGFVRDQGYKTVYTGDGADEVLAGYDCFRQDFMRRRFNGPVSRLFRRRHYLNEYTQYFARDHMQLLLGLHTARSQRETIERFGCYPPWHDFGQITRTERAGVMHDDADIDGESQWDELLSGMRPALEGRDALNQSLYFEMKTRLPGWILWKSDRLSMAHGVEARVPFLDHPLVELLARMPPTLKLNGMDEKYILKRTMSRRLPSSSHNFKKRGFYSPITDWFFTPARAESLSPYLSRDALRQTGVFDPDHVEVLQRQLAALPQPTDMDTYYRSMRLEWVLFTVLTTQILSNRYVERPWVTHVGEASDVDIPSTPLLI